MTDRTVSVRLDAVVGPYQAAMARASASTKQLTADTVKFGKVHADTMVSVGKVTTLGLTAPLALLAKQSVDYAKTAQETGNRVTVAFGKQEAALHKWSQGSSHTMGLAQHEAEGSAATFKVMLDEMGLVTQESYKMATGIVKLAADVGSFRDVDPSEMLTKMSAGIIGEYEPLRQLGIVLTDAQVRQEAVRLGLAESTKEVTTAGLVQSRYSLILQQTSKDQGDYARTADSATNATRTASAAYKDAMTELGDNLLPLVAKGAVTVTALAEAFTSLPDGAQQVILGFGGILAITGPLLIALGSILRNLEQIKKTGGALGTVGKVGGYAVGILAVAQAASILDQKLTEVIDHDPDITRMGNSLLDFAQQGQVAGEMARLFGSDLGGLADGIARLSDRSLGDQIFGELTFGGKGQLDRATEDVNALDEALANMVSRGNGDQAAKMVAGLKTELAAFGISGDRVDAALNDYTAAAEGSALAAREAASGTDDLGNSASGAAGPVGTLAQQLEKLSGSFDSETATDSFNQQLLDFVDNVMAAKVNGDKFATSLSEGSATGLANREMLRGLSERLIDYAGSAGATVEGSQRMRGEMIHALEQMGFNTAEAGRYTDVLLGLDGLNVTSTISVDGTQARAEINAIIGGLNEVQKRKAAALFSDVLNNRAKPEDWKPMPTAPTPSVRTDLEKYLHGGGPNTTSARESGAGGASKAADEAKKAREDALREQQSVTDNAFDLGLYRYDDYLAELDRRMKVEESQGKKLTDSWKAIYDRRAQVVKEHNDKIGAFYREHQAATREIEDNQYAAGVISTVKYRQILQARADDAEKIHGRYSDEAEAFYSKIRKLDEDASDAAVKVQKDAFDKLTSMLGDEQKIRKQMADAADAHRKKLAEINKGFLADQQAALDERRQQLLGWARIDEQAVINWGNTAAALTSNVLAQTNAFAEWADGLDALRRSGVSETVIGMLGLDEGPQMLGQVRSLSSATQAEIAALNEAVAAKSAQASGRVSAEQAQTYSKISQTLKGITERYAAEVEAETEAFLATMRDLNGELALIGFDGASAFGQSIADGLNSKIPAIREAALAARAAQQAAQMAAQPPTSVTGSTRVRLPNGEERTAAEWAWIFGVPAGPDGLFSLPSHAVGTSFVDHTGPANIHYGERVLSAVDNVKLVAAVQSMAGGSSRPVYSPSFAVDVFVNGVKADPGDVQLIWREDAAGIARSNLIGGRES